MGMYGSPRLVCDNNEPSMTKQSFKKQVDINNIIAGYQRNGLITHVSSKKPIFADVTGVKDYQSAVDAVKAADASFMAMPPYIRKFFANDPGKMIAFLADSKNVDKAVELGLMVRKEPVKAPEPPKAGDPAPKA